MQIDQERYDYRFRLIVRGVFRFVPQFERWSQVPGALTDVGNQLFDATFHLTFV